VNRLLRVLARVPWYPSIARPLLFRLRPETAQHIAETALRVRPLWRLHAAATGSATPHLRRTVAGIDLANPVGLAAGFDKDCAYLAGLADMGFGYLVGGTVTRTPRPGNAQPRLLRVPDHHALINAMGFPSKGVDVAVARLRAYADGGGGDGAVPVFVSIAALGEDETMQCLISVEPFAAAVELNISSPNTRGVREYQDPERLRRLLERLNEHRRKPLLIKLPAYQDEASRDAVLALVRTCQSAGAAGVTTSNTLPVNDARLAVGSGGLSGQPLFTSMLEAVREIRRETGASFVVNACGGISSASDALKALEAGADTVQLYTALVYHGPGLVNNITRELERRAMTTAEAS